MTLQNKLTEIKNLYNEGKGTILLYCKGTYCGMLHPKLDSDLKIDDIELNAIISDLNRIRILVGSVIVNCTHIDFIGLKGINNISTDIEEK